VASYRTPRGSRNQGALEQWFGTGAGEVGLNSEIIIGSTHTGTHVDALSHVACGQEARWHGGYAEAHDLGDFGPLRAEASSIAPFLCRGVLVDLPAALGVDILAGRHLVDRPQVERALERQGVELRAGDAVLFHTGYMQAWGVDRERAGRHHGAGIGHDVATWLADLGVLLVGADTESLERDPAVDERRPYPVHVELLMQRGIHILELAWLEGLARDRIDEFLFICLPLRIRGATGSMVRPVAVV
jgi:kynurenine formamidase